MENRLTPIAPAERIAELDILRAFALFGILCVNMSFFRSSPLVAFLAEKPPHGVVDAVVEFFLRSFTYGKFNSMFSFLLGVGMTIQILRAEQRGVPFTGLYMRRLLALLAIGLIHAFGIWYGDVLVFYSLLGFILLALRRAPSKMLFAVAGVCLLVPIGLEVAKLLAPAGDPEEAKMVAGFAAADFSAHTHGTWMDVFQIRVGMNLFFYTSPLGLAFASDLLLTMCLGLWAGRARIFQDLDAHLPFLRRVRLIGGSIGIPAGLAYGAFSMIHGDDFTRSDLSSVAYTFAYAIGRPALMLFYVSSIALLLRGEAWREKLSIAAWIGRMPLTNYLLQSVVCTLIFYGFAGGLYGKVGYALGFGLTALIWMAQIPFSYWWLQSFRFGPVEWLWRSITYLSPQPMRRPQTEAI